MRERVACPDSSYRGNGLPIRSEIPPDWPTRTLDRSQSLLLRPAAPNACGYRQRLVSCWRNQWPDCTLAHTDLPSDISAIEMSGSLVRSLGATVAKSRLHSMTPARATGQCYGGRFVLTEHRLRAAGQCCMIRC